MRTSKYRAELSHSDNRGFVSSEEQYGYVMANLYQSVHSSAHLLYDAFHLQIEKEGAEFVYR